jgi:hypothetical protein
MPMVMMRFVVVVTVLMFHRLMRMLVPMRLPLWMWMIMAMLMMFVGPVLVGVLPFLVVMPMDRFIESHGSYLPLKCY